MSMNIYITATRVIRVIKTNELDIQTTKFDAIQTPTNITYDILNSENQIQAYIDYVMTFSKTERIPIYAENDYFMENEPIGYQEYNDAEMHVKTFQKWVQEMNTTGYDIQMSAI